MPFKPVFDGEIGRLSAAGQRSMISAGPGDYFPYFGVWGNCPQGVYGRQVERMLKCGSCGVQYLLREAAEKVDSNPLIALKCSSCGGDLKVM